MSDQLAFDFTLPALQQTPAVQLSSLSTSESTAPKEDKFMYGGSSAKETKFFKMFSLLAAESNRALHTFFEDFCLMGGVLFTISACRNRCWHVICPNTSDAIPNITSGQNITNSHKYPG